MPNFPHHVQKNGRGKEWQIKRDDQAGAPRLQEGAAAGSEPAQGRQRKEHPQGRTRQGPGHPSPRVCWSSPAGEPASHARYASDRSGQDDRIPPGWMVAIEHQGHHDGDREHPAEEEHAAARCCGMRCCEMSRVMSCLVMSRPLVNGPAVLDAVVIDLGGCAGPCRHRRFAARPIWASRTSATVNPRTRPTGPRNRVPSRASSQLPATPGRNITRPSAMIREDQTRASPIGDPRDDDGMATRAQAKNWGTRIRT